MPKNSWSQNSYWVYTLRVNNFNEKNRDIFLNNLKERGIDCRPGFYPLHTMKPYKIYGSSQFENTVKISNNSIRDNNFKIKSKLKKILKLTKELKKLK